MKNKTEGSIKRTFRITRQILTPVQKRRGLTMSVLSTISSLTEVFSLATLIPVVMACAAPDRMLQNKYFNFAYTTFHFHSARSFLIAILLSIIVFFALKSVFSLWVNYEQSRFTAQVVYTLMQRQLHKHSALKYSYFNDLGSGRLINSSFNIPGAYLGCLLRPFIALGTEAVIAATIIIGLVLYKPGLIVLLVVTLVPPSLLAYRLVRGRLQYIAGRINSITPVVIRYVTESFTGFVELRLARRQQHLISNIMEIQRESYGLETKSFVYAQIPPKVIELSAVMGVIVILLYSLTMVDDAASLIGLVGLFAAAAYRLMPSLNRILTSIVMIRSNQHILDDIESLNGPEAQEPSSAQQPLRFEQKIELKDVSFSFQKDGDPALDNISLTIRKGEKIGFIGTSGSGKTTLMNILLRFYKEEQGQILVDGVPLGPENIDAWHHLIGYVKQDTFLMDASIRDNITLGEATPDQQRLTYAIEQASLTSMIDNLPQGLDTFIGERGSKISGGQRQRIGIARAMYKQTQLLILDEATSALDNETEREVSEAINHLSQGNLTIIIVAHRLTTLRECDRVYELSHGKLVAEHQYETLLERIK